MPTSAARERSIGICLKKGPNQSPIDDCIARELEQVLTRYFKRRRVIAEFHQASEEYRYVGDFALLEDWEVLVQISITEVNCNNNLQQ